MSRILKIDKDHPEPSIIYKAAAILKEGGIIISPTETLYGMLCRADRIESVREIYKIKGRNLDMPCSIFVDSIDQITNLGELDQTAKTIALTFLPGPLTLVLKNLSSYEKPIVNNEKIGFRYSSCPVIIELLQILKIPLTATSANLSGNPELITVDEMVEVFGEKINLYLDSGPLKALTSTVVECLENKFNILRRGAISEADIKNCLKG
ncbi:MAG: L-threonylcarbamoyladenylate synthase [Candidatus Zixiibacteriota bacterium]